VKNPVHTYLSPGTYTVTLTASNAGGSNSVTQTDYIAVSAASITPPTASFNGTPSSGSAPLTVRFTDSSINGPIVWQWNFGDGNTTNSTVKNPVHTYLAPGTYTVSLTASNAGGSNSVTQTDYIAVSAAAIPAPVAGFTGTPTSGAAPLTVTFTDTSTSAIPIASWLWDFGDGTSSTDVNPTHIYTNVGIYVVNHTVTNTIGNWSSAFETIMATAAPSSGGEVIYDTGRGSGGGGAPSGPAAAVAPAGQPAVEFRIAEEGQTLATYTVSTPSEATVEASVTVERGTTITDPAGNFVNSLSVSQVSVEDVPSMPEGAGFSFSGYAVQCGPEGVTFDQPVSFTFSLTQAQWNDALAQANGNPALMEIQFYDKATQSWVGLPTTVNAATREVTALVDHFSLFALVITQAPPATPAAEVPTVAAVSPVPTTEPTIIIAKTPTTPKPTPTPFVSIPAMIGVLVVAGLAYSLARKR
jgi:PKD repeat protein